MSKKIRLLRVTPLMDESRHSAGDILEVNADGEVKIISIIDIYPLFPSAEELVKREIAEWVDDAPEWVEDESKTKNFSMILSHQDESLLEKVKELTGESTRKHAILAMAREYVKAHQDAEKLKKEVLARREKNL